MYQNGMYIKIGAMLELSKTLKKSIRTINTVYFSKRMRGQEIKKQLMLKITAGTIVKIYQKLQNSARSQINGTISKIYQELQNYCGCKQNCS